MRFPALLLLLAAPAASAQPVHVAPTEAQSPADEQKTFKLPPGFAVQLVASEPDIGKPMQMAFDAKGRLWVTTSRHYPFAVADDKATDKLYVLSDFGPDGKAKAVSVFAANLNIPIGILPLPDCRSCIVSSVGRILKLTDTDGDGTADKTDVLFTGFGTKDTHGMVNSFTHMPDGWVYACHGYLNESRVKGTDGHEVHMHSGHTFRFRPDGSRIEVYTRGQVNPFGMTADPWFNLYTADCHSKPITQLIRGAHYQSFGKPHDGLGFAPHVTRHDHGSTALCGLAWYDADHFPKEFAGTMFLGNVVTNRVNFDKIEWKGSTPVAVEQPDFLVSSDPWFRPTDIKLGPDGALYIADFYNRIIGHYEVDLTHPGRDRDRGRVWRVVWKGTDGKAGRPTMPFDDLTRAEPERIASTLASPNAVARMFTLQECFRRQGDEAVLAAVAQVAMREPRAAPYFDWMLERSGGFRTVNDMLLVAFTAIKGTEGRAGAIALHQNLMRPLSARGQLTDEFRKRVAECLRVAVKGFAANRDGTTVDGPHQSNQSARVLIDLASAFPHPDYVALLAETMTTIPAADTHLRHAARIALRNALASDAAQTQLVWMLKDKLADKDAGRVFDDVFLGVPNAYAGWWLSERAAAGTLDPAAAVRAFEQVGRYGCDRHRKAMADSLAAVTDERQAIARVAALSRGAQAAGVAFQPDATAARVRAGLASDDSELVRECLTLAAAIDIPVAELAAPIARDPKRPVPVRVAALDVLAKSPRTWVRTAFADLVPDATVPLAVREKAASALAGSTDLQDLIGMKNAVKTAPHRLAVVLAVGLAGSQEGADLLLAAVGAGEASPRLLQERFVAARLKATGVRDLDARVAELTKGLPSADARIQAVIQQRAAGFRGAKGKNVEAGKAVFAARCAACHQIGGQGGKVAPNLDGIGNRGLDRLLEDVLDPNRNVDVAFRATTLELDDGRVLTGLLVREEGAVYLLADAEGKEQRVPKKGVLKKATTAMSPMPADWAEKLPEGEFHNLMRYLLEQRAK